MAIKVLVLDDEREILESLRRMLELDPRLEVITCDDPKKALELIAKENIQIVLCDIVMPEMDGLEFLLAAKAVNGLVQVIMMSAYSTVERVIASLERGAADYLIKPFDMAEVKEVINDVIKRLERWRSLVIRARGIQDREKREEPGVKSDVEEANAKLEALLKERPPNLSEILLGWLESERNQMVRERLLEVLSDVFSERPEKEVLRRMLSSKDAFVRNGAVEIGKRLGAKALGVLEELLEDENEDVRKLALDIAAFVRDKRVVELMRRALQDPDPNVRMTAAEYLGERGDEKAASLIEERLFSEDEPLLVATFLETLTQIGTSPNSRRVIERFKERVDPVLLHSFLKYLGAFGEEEDLRWIEEALEKGKISVTRELVDALFGILSRKRGLKLSPHTVEALKAYAEREDKVMGVYQILQVLNLCCPEEALRLAEKWQKEGPEVQKVAAGNFLCDLGKCEREFEE